MRKYHTSAVTEAGLLLVGGTVEPTKTELIPFQGIWHLLGKLLLFYVSKCKRCSSWMMDFVVSKLQQRPFFCDFSKMR